ncbi:MAG: hypothetical protein GTO41_10500 [Burkholderiales bacterium]|nr:hypothetical protein [Burkholderiales bacterium]
MFRSSRDELPYPGHGCASRRMRSNLETPPLISNPSRGFVSALPALTLVVWALDTLLTLVSALRFWWVGEYLLELPADHRLAGIWQARYRRCPRIVGVRVIGGGQDSRNVWSVGR